MVNYDTGIGTGASGRLAAVGAVGGVVACGGIANVVGSGMGATRCEETPDVIVVFLGFGKSPALIGFLKAWLALVPPFVFGFGACASFSGEFVGCVVALDLSVGRGLIVVWVVVEVAMAFVVVVVVL